jgi:GNAT superfamily N-acetyltransferase
MSDVTVRALGGDDWQTYRQVRLAALKEAPDAFVSGYDDEVGYDEDFWRLRMSRSTRLVAVDGVDRAIGIVSVGQSSDEDVAELFGMWVEPPMRGAGVARALTESAARHALETGHRAIKLWVPADHGRAVAFFSSHGFRPTDERRPMRTDADVDEVAMVLPVGEARG